MGYVFSSRALALVCYLLILSAGTQVYADGGNTDLNWQEFFPGVAIPATHAEAVGSTSNPITVCSSGCNYSHIQDAINASVPGDLILVEGGIYPETLTIPKMVTIQGVNGTVTVGDPSQDYAINITGELVIIQNISVTSARKSAIQVSGNLTLLEGLNLTAHNPDDPISPVITGHGSIGIILINCSIASSGATGIALENTQLVGIRNCIVNLTADPENLHTGIDIVQKSIIHPEDSVIIQNNLVQGGGISVGPENRQGEQIVFPPIDNVQIANNTVLNSNFWGIQVGGLEKTGDHYLKNLSLTNNQVTGTKSSYGAITVESFSSGVIANNSVNGFTLNGDGVELKNLDSFTIINNIIRDGIVNENGGWAGMAVIQVSNSTIRQNTLQNVTPYRFYYAPGLNLQPNLTFDTTNTADGQPVLYNEQKNGLIIDNSSNPAMVVLMSCTNTTVRNVSISDSGLGVGIYGGENTRVTGSHIATSSTGLMLIRSNGSTITGNSVSDTWMGMGIGENQQATITNNSITGFEDSGVVIHGGRNEGVQISNNSLYGVFSEKDQGFALVEANGSSVNITNNTISHTTRGMLITLAEKFLVQGNLIEDSGVGLNLNGAQKNRFLTNTINNTDAFSEGIYLVNSHRYGGGISKENQFTNNYIRSEIPVNLTTVDDGFRGPVLDNQFWGSPVSWALSAESGEGYVNTWNLSKTPGSNIVNGSFLGGNFYSTPEGTGWSETHADRGDGFVAEPYLIDANNTDYLPLHNPGVPTPTPTPSPTPTPTISPTITPTTTPTLQPVAVNFTATPLTGIPPLTVRFTDQSSGNPTGWNWTFGDGAVSHEQNPSHMYTGIGRYSVTLEARNSQGQDIMRKSSYIVPTSGRVTGPNGMIWITSAPSGAQVYVDQVFVGETPLQSMGLPAGIRQVRISSTGYHDWIGYVQVNAGTFTYVPKVILQRS